MDDLLTALDEYTLPPDVKRQFWKEFFRSIAINESLHSHTEDFIKGIFRKFDYHNEFDINNFYVCLTGLKRRFLRESFVPNINDYLKTSAIIKQKVYIELKRYYYRSETFVETYNEDWQIAIFFTPGPESSISPKEMSSIIAVVIQEIYEERLFKGETQLCNFTALSSKLSGYSALREGFLQASELSELSFFRMKTIVVTEEDINEWRKEVDYYLLNTVNNELKVALNEGDQKNCNDYLETLFNNLIKESFNLSLCSNTLSLMEDMLKTSCLVYDITQPPNIKNVCDINSYFSIEECCQALKTVFADICDQIKKHGKYSSIVQSAIYFIKNNYYHDTPLSSIAEYAKVTPSYLSGIFKRDVGMAVSEYILTTRIKNAKLLLKTTERTVNQIARDVGFNDIKYFRRMFKNLVNLSPLEYRNNIEVAAINKSESALHPLSEKVVITK